MLLVTAVEGVVIALLGGPHLLLGADPEALEIIGTGVVMTIALTLASWPIDLWLKPYVTVSECKFYEWIKIGEERVPF